MRYIYAGNGCVYLFSDHGLAPSRGVRPGTLRSSDADPAIEPVCKGWVKLALSGDHEGNGHVQAVVRCECNAGHPHSETISLVEHLIELEVSRQ